MALAPGEELGRVRPQCGPHSLKQGVCAGQRPGRITTTTSEAHNRPTGVTDLVKVLMYELVEDDRLLVRS